MNELERLYGRENGYRRQGLLGAWWEAMTLSLDAWSEERRSDAQVRILQARQRVIEAQREVIETELIARRDLGYLAAQAEQAAAEFTFWQTFQATPYDEQQDMLERQKAIEELLLERDYLRQQRLSAPIPTLPQARVALPEPEFTQSNELPMHPYISDQAIEKIATKSVARLGHLRGQAADQAWSAWREQLREQGFPPMVEQEITERATELRELAEDD